MAQDIYITRAAHHFDGAQTPITEGDWRAIIENDPDLEAPDEALLSYAVWAGPTRTPALWIDWANGNLFSRNPNEALLRKLIELAELLGAWVQGHDGKVYRVKNDRVVRGEGVAGRSETHDPNPSHPDTAEDPDLGDILGSEEAALDDDLDPLAELSSEVLFGPRPRNAESHGEAEAPGGQLPADASFAPQPEELLALEVPSKPKLEVPFQVGQRVQTEWGRPATIVSIDCEANLGMGQIEIRYDDGRVATTDCVSHGLQPMGPG